MKYEVHILKVEDADAIVIKYWPNESSKNPITAVIDAGNIEDGAKVVNCIGYSEVDKICHINYAFCTHPDIDHKGGFFDLFENSRVKIENMYLFDPWKYLTKEDFARLKLISSAKERARLPFIHTKDSTKNLIDIAEKKGVLRQIQKGMYFNDIPISVLGPSNKFYRECALGMMENYAEIVDDANFEPYDVNTLIDEDSARSVIDLDDDNSCSNRSSIILLFEPPNGRRYLFPGDAACDSLSLVINEYISKIRGCILKVPHHGSKHNLSTKIIDCLKPRSAVISAKGSRKHPNSGIVYWLSKHCNVYSTHKSNGLIYGSEIYGNAIPLKEKIKE